MEGRSFEEVMKKQTRWIQTEDKWAYKSIGIQLHYHGMLSCFEEILHNIHGPLFDGHQGTTHGVNYWTMEWIVKWINTLTFLQPSVAKVLCNECIDGQAFMDLDEKDWQTMGLCKLNFFLLKKIRDGWLGIAGKAIPWTLGSSATVTAGVRPNQQLNEQLLSEKLSCSESKSSTKGNGVLYGQFVVLGYKEYRLLPVSHKYNTTGSPLYQPIGISNDKLVLSKRKMPNGLSIKSTYTTTRQAVAATRMNTHTHTHRMIIPHTTAPPYSLGTKPSATIKNNSLLSLSYAFGNTHFPHIRRNPKQASAFTEPHALHAVTTEECANVSDPQVVVFDYASDNTKDIYQLGRMSGGEGGPSGYGNDFTIKGALHENKEHGNRLTGPISRYACRVECNRFPPYQCHLFAGGFDQNQEIIIGDASYSDAVPMPSTHTHIENSGDPVTITCMDALTSFGIRLWSPKARQWCEVSTTGQVYSCRTRQQFGTLLHTKGDAAFTNELTDGCIIDLCGVSLEFQKANTVTNQLKIDPQRVIKELNSLKPHCPVLFSSIEFAYLSNRQRALRVVHQMEEEGKYTGVGGAGFHVPTSDYRDIEENSRTYVFPACGHVYGFHTSLQHKPCPLCRSKGPFVPIAFSFESSICSGKPTHVFNPCGHVASKQTCEKWSQVPMHDLKPPTAQLTPKCPFCATSLAGGSGSAGPAYCRLMFEHEGTFNWPQEPECSQDVADKTLKIGQLTVNTELVTHTHAEPTFTTPLQQSFVRHFDEIDP